MPLSPPDPVLPTDTVHLSSWFDPVDARTGHDLRSTYVEHFWLPILGPTTTLLLRRLAAELDRHPDGVDLPVLDTAHALGLGSKGGRNSPFLRAFARATSFQMLRAVSAEAFEVRHRAPSLSYQQVARLPASLRDAHDAWQAQDRQAPSADDVRRRARRLALSLLELGETDEAVEHQLHRWKIHPAFAHEGLQWAKARRKVPVASLADGDGDTTEVTTVSTTRQTDAETAGQPVGAA